MQSETGLITILHCLESVSSLYCILAYTLQQCSI